MECNKDEATRAREISERKFMAKDMVGAKKFALKAQNLYPALEGIQQMVATLDVYISAENKISGESDWYGILGAKPSADDETVRKHYRKLALLLHPDKNKSIGAEGAFKLISEAWSLLSDKGRREAFDQKRNANRGPSAPPSSNGFYHFTKTSTVKTKKNATQATSSTPTPSHKSQPVTFWTVCHKCKMQYEYLRKYLNHNLLCPNCREAFFAMEIAPPPTHSSKSSTTQWNFSQKRQNSDHQAGSKSTERKSAAKSNNRSGFQWSGFSKTSGSSTAAQAATMVQQAYEKVRREREEAQAAKRKEEAMRRKKRMAGFNSNADIAKRRKGSDDAVTGKLGQDFTNLMGMESRGTSAANNFGSNQGNFGSNLGNFEIGRFNRFYNYNSTRNVPQLGIQHMLMEKARKEIHKKLNECTSINASVTGSTSDFNKPSCNDNTTNESQAIKSFPSSSGGNVSLETSELMSVGVPDPDFHDFDKDRNERSFEDNQVWSAYDDDDGMPRYYAMIHNVISRNPFKMRISWLNSKANSELGPLNWIGSGFPKTCGDFRVGKYEMSGSLNSFSHKVRWAKGTRGVIRIFPRKGEVWALYRNWSPEWNELTADEVIHKYDMVEVLDDYDEEEGVTIVPLVKVAGFKTVFHRHLDPRQVRSIPKEEMFRFSHHVPSYLLTGREAPNAPKGCRELDPAAIPLELLQIIKDIEEEETVEIEEVEDKSMVDRFEESNYMETVENFEATRDDRISRNSTDIQEVEILDEFNETKIDKRLDHPEQTVVS